MKHVCVQPAYKLAQFTYKFFLNPLLVKTKTSKQANKLHAGIRASALSKQTNKHIYTSLQIYPFLL